MINVGQYLSRIGKCYPQADADGNIPMERFEQAGIPAVMACAGCEMTFVLTPERPCDESGRVFCSSECAGVES